MKYLLIAGLLAFFCLYRPRKEDNADRRAANIEKSTHATCTTQPQPTPIGAVSPAAVHASRKFPTVHRSALHVLDALDSNFVPKSQPHSPLVTHLPEFRVSHRSHCLSGNTTCRFILPIRIAEQESKARVHFLQLLKLAIKLDRVLVLPQVDNSRLGACLGQPFQKYYDLERLQVLHGTHIITLKQFKQWVRKHGSSATSQLVSFHSAAGEQGTTIGPINVFLNQTPSYDSLPSCMSKRFPLLKLEPPSVSINPVCIRHEHKPPIGNAVAGLFSQHVSDILVIDYNMRHPIFLVDHQRQLDIPLMYTPTLYKEALWVAPSAPYIAVHWRMETVPSSLLSQCAQDLIATLRKLVDNDPSLESVWFATDYRKSQTFKTRSADHRMAIETFQEAFSTGRSLEKMKLTSLQGTYNDSGIRGIIDKLVMVQADVFVSGGKGCSRQQSSYTKQIVDAKKERDGFILWETFG